MEKTVVVAHPSPDLYGSDRMLLESVRAVSPTRRVLVTLPSDGPLRAVLADAGAEVVIMPTPVLRKAFLSPIGMIRLALAALRGLRPAMRLLRDSKAEAVYVSTVTIPLWLVAAKLARVPALCHVHEAEEAPRPIRFALALPLRLAALTLVNSRASAEVLGLPRAQVVYNGVAGPPEPTPARRVLEGTVRLVLVGRWSPRKGTDVAVAAARLLRERGHDVRLTLVGDVFAGYEWYERELREQAGPETEFAGFRADVWDALADADIALVPSRAEPFGNVAVEAMLAGRPVVAAATQGLTEIIDNGVTGVLVRPDDPAALADGVESLFMDWERALTLAADARSDAALRFTRARYGEEIKAAVDHLTARTTHR
ncbi:glycosyltransferase family 4 protein [Actinocorallia sp. A-T 12471]|uniref:glycosyltransferase family 4 protein n=1 Tax=Actinocorallia sp. A-T 12471 TaxID=3089813 RepID=UPI0029CEC537|nr:glycosyltransferase family 4 protein [Actinocorallia sp. A-T 12471]MDX6738514.1 glycosyltransferase family 4 protein [Actinocorallia sp. A-T 12471]